MNDIDSRGVAVGDRVPERIAAGIDRLGLDIGRVGEIGRDVGLRASLNRTARPRRQAVDGEIACWRECISDRDVGQGQVAVVGDGDLEIGRAAAA